MAEETNGNGARRSGFDWRMAGLVIFAWIASALIQWGTTSAQITDHARRLEFIERKMDERSVARDEYDRRHEDLVRQVEEIRVAERDLEKRMVSAGR